MKTIRTIVFKAKEGGGNPCPVTLDADALSLEEMQAMTSKEGVECAFVLKPTRPDCDFMYRYFLPRHELGMCLHATIGTSTVLVREGRAAKSPFYVETILGRIRIDWKNQDGRIEISVQQFLPEVKNDVPSVPELVKALGIRAEDLGKGPVQSVSTSRYKLFIPLRDREVLDHLEPDFPYLWELCDKYGVTGFCPFAPAKSTDNDEGGTVFYDRQFPNKGGYNEDPATGVAAASLGSYAVLNGPAAKDGWHHFVIYQGFAMGRPSRLQADILVKDGKIAETRVVGDADVIEG